MKWVTVVLSFALVCCQYSLWFGKGSIGRNSSLREQIAVQEEKTRHSPYAIIPLPPKSMIWKTVKKPFRKSPG
ncbi:Cell division protein ftsB-like protein [Neisseria gonorrhoeae]|uniref:Cell division protein ftsB-like protein n=1 Tax=Neisseria gonorrhoeae TaxID=485 RepID=A0A378W016_NEIGO|nr:Cell division protein ftsB-like protein [Neisseria gonorrhoeae]